LTPDIIRTWSTDGIFSHSFKKNTPRKFSQASGAFSVFQEAISKVFQNGRKFLLRSANGAFSMVTLWVATLKLPFPTHQQSFFSQILPDF